MNVWTLLVLSVGLVASGCATRTVMLVQRAAPDLACPEEKVVVIRVDGEVYEARGCGQRRRYIYACNNQHRCGWLPNEPVTGEGSQSPSAPATTAATPPVPVVKSDARVETGRSSSGSKQLKLYMEIEQPSTLLYVIATPGHDGDRAMLMWRVPKLDPEPECTIQLVADGNALPLGAETKRFSRRDFSDYQTDIPYGSLTLIAQSSRVAGRLCETEIVLSPAQLEKARELDVRLREERAWQPQP